MSKDMLGSVVRAAVGVPQDRLDLLARVASKIAGDNPQGAAWYSWIDQSVDQGLPVVEPVVEPPKPTLIFLKQTMLGSTPVTVYGLAKRLTLAQMFCAQVKLAPDAPIDVIEKLLKERKHALSPERLEEILDKQAKFFLKQKGGEDFGLRDDGWANLILVENADGTVSVVYAYWYDSRWNRYRISLDYENVWRREDRLVVGNSDASNL